LVNGRTNELVKSSELISIALLNAANKSVVDAGKPIDPENEAMQHGERWGAKTVTLVNPVDLGAALTSEGMTNATFIVPTPTNSLRDGRGPPRRESRSGEPPGPPPPDNPGTAVSTNAQAAATNISGPPPERENRRRDGEGRRGRPPWLRWMDE